MKSACWLTRVVCLCLIAIAPAANAADDWREVLRRAENADVRHEYVVAVKEYSSALEKMPATEENARAKTLALLSEAHFALRQYEAASSIGIKAIESALQLRMKNKLEPEVLESIQLLYDTSRYIANHGLPPGVQQHVRALEAINKLDNALAKIFPVKDTPDNHIRAARQRASVGNYRQAEQDLQRLLQQQKPNADEVEMIKLYIAALRAKQGHPEALNKLQQEVSKKHSQATAWRNMGEARLWLYDLKGSLQAYNHALTLLPKSNKDWQEEGKIISGIAVVYQYDRNYKAAEPFWRRDIELYSKHPEAAAQLKVSQRCLILCLQHLHRDKEAAKILPPKTSGFSDFEFLLSDEEKAALAKRKTKEKAGSSHP